MESPGTDQETHCALLKFTTSTDFLVMPSFNHCGSDSQCSVRREIFRPLSHTRGFQSGVQSEFRLDSRFKHAGMTE
jgi:hypothetical protein